MRSRSFRRLFACFVVLVLGLGVLPRLGAQTGTLDDLPLTVPVDAADAIALVEAQAVGALDALRPKTKGVRVALLSTGVDARVLPEGLWPSLTHVWGAHDRIGYGTYTASILLQLLDEPRIRSFNLYAGERFDVERQRQALRWVENNAAEVDVVLVAVPTHEFLDPVSSAMDAGEWTAVTEAMGAEPHELAWEHRRALASYERSVSVWQETRERLASINDRGVGVVVPAGDVGPGIQTILGLANLPEVVTVGGSDGSGVSAHSASGPSIDGSVKPDLVAPTGFVGLLPVGSELATTLHDEGLLDAGLEPAWDAGEASTDARARLDTSVSAAALVAAAIGGMAAEGVDDVAVQRGALTAASVPLDDAPVWRQGAGALRGVPDAAFASSRPLALGHGDLGPEPEDGSWSTLVAFTGGEPQDAHTAITGFAGVDPDGRTVAREARGSGSPAVGAGVSEHGVRVSAPIGDGRYEGGLYCGYTEVSLPLTSGDVDPSVTIDGVPEGLEQVPTCLVKGTQVRAHGFYIHELPAEDLTFALLPELPAEASILHKPLMLLPVNPMHTRIYTKVTDADGNAYFRNVPPGYYAVRLFSDYGSPVTETLTDAATGAPVVETHEIGRNPSYEGFDALILGATGWTEQDLRETFGDGNVEADRPHQAWWVTVGERRIRVVLDQLKKMPGAGVTSRYIDLLAYDDLDFSSVDVADVPLGGLGVAGEVDGWTFARGMDSADRVVAAFNPLLAADTQMAGIARYPFNLTTPNYTAHMSLNFSYEVSNAAILAVVQVGDEVAMGVVTSQGTMRSPTVGPFTPLGSNGVAVDGHATGLASFDFRMLPRGVSEGTLYLVFLPSEPVQGLATPLSTASVDDLSFMLSTWQRTPWPAIMHPDRGMGHSFTVQPNYSERQMSAPDCRTIVSGGVEAEVCEDWQIQIHSALDDAATFDLRVGDDSIIEAMRDGGSRYADPGRGVLDASAAQSFALAGTGVSFDVDGAFRTNGRFWEQLSITRATLAAYPGDVLVRIVDKEPGRSSDLFTHIDGAMPVAAYVPFASEAVVVDGLAVEVSDTNGDGVPEEVSVTPPYTPALPDVVPAVPTAVGPVEPEAKALVPRRIGLRLL